MALATASGGQMIKNRTGFAMFGFTFEDIVMCLDDTLDIDRISDAPARNNRRLDYSYVHDLIAVLTKNPNGLRRWSVMQALRKTREKAGRNISQKFEDEIEHMFRRFCASPENVKSDAEILFYRPAERAGEVWCVYPERAETWLKSAAGKN
jgi:hypothetical protein